MSGISFGGLSSGIDTESIISAMISAESVPMARINSQKSNIDAALLTINSITGKFSTLKTASQALSSATGFASFKSTSSDSAVVATVTGAATTGAYDLTVQQLAKEQRTYSNAQTSSTAALGMAGDFSIAVGSGSPATITVAATDTLTDIAAKINQSGQRVGASILFDGTNYKLQVRGLDTGAANSVTFAENGTALGLATPANTVQAAQDAMLTIDGNVITRATNQVNGVIPGVTLALTKTTTSPATIKVESDPDALIGKIQTFVTAYNDIVSASQAAAGWGNFKASNQELAGDSTLRGVLDRLSRQVGAIVPGTTGKYQTLPSIGLGSTKDGKLSLDTAKLKTALEADPSAVQKLFVNDPALGSTGAMVGMVTLVDQQITGSSAPLKAKAEAYSKRSLKLTEDSDAIQRRLDLMETQLRNRFTQLEMIMSKYKTQGSALGAITTTTTTG
ncbi:MAG: flagellar filament capping protein FliD [Myxococcales bacterium]|nr:flagellar filament capping protein FliD [Myxococcales bacterium]